MKTEQTIAQFLNIKDLPFEIKDKNGNLTYFEGSNGYWEKRDYDERGKVICCKNSNGVIMERC